MRESRVGEELVWVYEYSGTLNFADLFAGLCAALSGLGGGVGLDVLGDKAIREEYLSKSCEVVVKAFSSRRQISI